MTVLRVYGKSMTSVLGALREAGPHRIRAGDGYIETVIRQKDMHKAIAICEERCYNYKIIGTMPHIVLRRSLAYLPLAIASVFAAVLIFASNAFVWRVEISGAEGAAGLRVREVLNEMGVRAGAVRSSVDELAVERALVEERGITAASVVSEGSVLRVEVLTAVPYGGSVAEGETLVSGYDCTVTRVVAECGTPVVSPGDVVARGDTLIEGKEYRTADGSESGVVAVRGRVYGRVTFTYSAPVADVGAPERTGKSTTVTSIGMLGLTIGADGCPYEYYESETETSQLYPLPIDVVRTTYHELSGISFDEEAARFASAKSDELTEKYGAVFDMRTEVKRREGVNIMTIYFTGEICVGEI